MTPASTLAWFDAEDEVGRWCHASKMFWSSTGPERVYWRGVWRHLIHQERERLQVERAALHAMYMRHVERGGRAA